MKKDKILIVISSDIFVRNYLTTNALKDLEQEFDCSYLISSSITQNEINLNNRVFLKYDKSPNDNLHYKILDLLMWRYKSKSKSFKYRIRRQFGLKNILFSNPKQFINIFLRRIYFSFITKSFFYDKYFQFVVSKLKYNKELENAVKIVDPALIIFPSSAYDPDGFDLLDICEANKIKSFYLVDNWDNLSSKSLLWKKPDYVSVWGEQSKIHASRIQNIETSKIFKIGTPRFDEYFNVRNREINSMFEFKYILFVGTSLAFDEASVLKQLNDIISTNNIFLDTKIIYRPHPWRAGRDSINNLKLSNVIIDPQLESKYVANDSSAQFQPSLDYYPSLIKNSEFVIGGLTSMLIESLIFYKKFIALVYEDSKFITSPRQVYLNYTHFENINNISTINFCEHIENLENILIDTWNSRFDVDKNSADLQREYFYHNNGLSYSKKLVEYSKLILETN